MEIRVGCELGRRLPHLLVICPVEIWKQTSRVTAESIGSDL